ncbi:unnamed protein product [Diplocarpon coronariae]
MCVAAYRGWLQIQKGKIFDCITTQAELARIDSVGSVATSSGIDVGEASAAGAPWIGKEAMGFKFGSRIRRDTDNEYVITLSLKTGRQFNVRRGH